MGNPETKICPFCAEEIKAAAVKCKHCGEYLESGPPKHRAAPTTPKSLPQQVPITVPKQPTVSVNTPERTLWEEHPAYISYLPAWIVGALLIGFCCTMTLGLTLTWIFTRQLPPDTSSFAALFIAPAGLLGISLLAWAYHHRNTTIYRITTHRVLCDWGIIGRQSDEVRLSDITAITMKQPWNDASLGIGNLEIATSGTAGVEVHLRGVRSPEKVREMIRHGRDAHGLGG